MKYLQGGTALPPLVSYLPVTVTGGAQQATSSKESKEDSNSDLTDKDLLEMLGKLDGLPSDMAILTQTLLNFYIDLQYGVLPSTSNIATRYLLTLNQMKVANANKKEYDNAFDIVSKNGGINELAINDRGQLYCVDQLGDFRLLTLEELKQSSDYLALTNSDLLYYRYESPKLANNNNLIKVIRNGIGMETVTKMILDNISNLGTSTESNEGYVRTLANLLVNGLQDFMKALDLAGDYNASVDNLYKGKMLNKNLATLALAALSYIYSTLPANAKTLLKTKTNNGTDKEAVLLISTLVNSKMSTTSDFSLDLEDTPQSITGKAGSDKSNLDADLVTSILAGHGGHDTIYSLDNKLGIEMTIGGTAYEQIKDTKGVHIGRTSVESLLNDSGLRSIINTDNGIFFGNQKVDADILLNVAYDGKGLLRVNLPVRSDGSPNFDLLEEYSKALSEFLLSQQTPEDSLRIFGDVEKYPGISLLVKPTGELDMTKFAPFIVASGMTTDSLIDVDKKLNKFITEIEQTPKLIEELKMSLSVGSGKERQTPDIDDYGWAEWFSMGLNGFDHIFRGNVYIPINMNKSAAALGGNLKLDTNVSNKLESEYLKSSTNYVNGDASLLNN